jgi:hypothetical protein
MITVSLLLMDASIGMAAGDSAPASNILIRAAVTPSENIVVGQRVILHVDVLAPDGWAQMKDTPAFRVEGAHVIRYESQGTRLNETIDGQAFSGQRYQFSLFPGRAGTITVPSIPVSVEISRWGSQSGKESREVKMPEVTFQADLPAGAEGVHGLVSTPELTADQAWDPDQQSFEVGGAIRRTIELTARDVSGMAFTPLRFEPTEGVSVYPAEPAVDDRYSRGTLTGKRVESVTYVFTGEGKVELPEIGIAWWNIDSEKLDRAVLPALQLEIAPSPTAVGSQKGTGATQADEQPLKRWLAILLIVLFLLLIPAAGYRKRIHAWWARRRQARREREEFYFKQFVRTTRSNDPRAAFNSLMRWLDRIHEGPGAARLDEFLQRYGDEKSRTEAEKLNQALRNGEVGWAGRPLVEAVGRARGRWKQACKKRAGVINLPPLNP